ncbi:MAG TPA: hypothetical protein VJ866_09455 [Pyrinomonadaceae bacterium]|nr:hypothetical protein [Pyrinomonadaceae bacterium]
MIHKLSRAAGAALAAFCLALLPAARAVAQDARALTAGLSAGASDANASGGAASRRLPKRLVLLRASVGGDGGARVTISSDSPLDDCESFRDGDDYTVRIPWAVAAGAALPGAEGRFYKSARVEERGDAVLVTFALREGASARLDRGFNRLEVTFAGAATPAATPARDNAEAETIREMREQIASLEARVRELESRQPAEAAHAPAAEAAAVANADAQPAANAAHAAHGAPSQHDHDAEPTGAPRLQIQGFADVNLNASNQPGSHTSFALGQLDLFLTSRLSEKFDVLSELIVEANRSNQFTFEIHRLLLQYTANDNLRLGVGRYHTAIGYYNTAYHHGSWFQTAANRPFIFAFEGKGGILPLHNVGVQATGRVPGAPWGLRYVAEIGNGRASRSPLDAPVQTALDENNRKAFNLGLFARPKTVPGLQTGFSVYRDRLAPANAPTVGQTIGAGYVVYQNARYESLNEFVLMRLATNGRVYNTPAFYTQLSRQFGSYRPFFRYQYINVPSDNPLYADVGRRNGPAFGVRYDVSDFAAFKAQYEHTSRRRLSSLDELFLQFAFTF